MFPLRYIFFISHGVHNDYNNSVIIPFLVYAILIVIKLVVFLMYEIRLEYYVTYVNLLDNIELSVIIVRFLKPIASYRKIKVFVL